MFGGACLLTSCCMLTQTFRKSAAVLQDVLSRTIGVMNIFMALEKTVSKSVATLFCLCLSSTISIKSPILSVMADKRHMTRIWSGIGGCCMVSGETWRNEGWHSTNFPEPATAAAGVSDFLHLLLIRNEPALDHHGNTRGETAEPQRRLYGHYFGRKREQGDTRPVSGPKLDF